MKRNKTFVLVMGMLLVFSVAMCAATAVKADPPFNSQCSALCSDFADLGLSHGECTSFCTTCTNNGNTGPVCTCKFLDAIDVLGLIYKNFGQCVKDLRQ